MSSSSQRLLFSGFSFFVAFAVLGLYFLMPLRETLRFGIDLVGGTYITLEVQTEKAVEAELMSRMQGIAKDLKENDLAQPVSKKIENEDIVFTFDSVNATQDAARFIKERDRELQQKVHENQVILSFTDVFKKGIEEYAVRSNIEVLRTRLDKVGVAEITIAPKGDRQIIVELPDVADPQQAKVMIGKAAVLEFKVVEGGGVSKEDILYEYDGELPEGKMIVPLKPGSREGRSWKYYLVSDYAEVTGKMLQKARPQLITTQAGMPEWVVQFAFTPDGGEKFYELTSRNIGRQLAIILDGEAISAPNVKEAIRGQGSISGSFTDDSAGELAMLLKSGAFVAPVTFEEERQVGPSLGKESIKQGLMSCLIGLALLFVFSFFYYNLSGLLAFVALIYNLFLVLMALAWLRATLTLPGIAGMVLTIGMAIDASILIFERIKEEITTGLSLKKAVNAGFSDAMVVILDANITTFIVGIVLYKFGTGPIQGFAVTMMMGIISTLVTGLFFLRSLFNFVLDLFEVQRLKI